MSRFWQIMDEAAKRYDLKQLVWKIYEDPKKVEEATLALKKILETS